MSVAHVGKKREESECGGEGDRVATCFWSEYKRFDRRRSDALPPLYTVADFNTRVVMGTLFLYYSPYKASISELLPCTLVKALPRYAPPLELTVLDLSRLHRHRRYRQFLPTKGVASAGRHPPC
jgi:hypothetical protein